MERDKVRQSHHLPVGIGEVDGDELLLGEDDERLRGEHEFAAGLYILLGVLLDLLLLRQDGEEVDDLRGEVEDNMLLVLALSLHSDGVTVTVHRALHATREEYKLVLPKQCVAAINFVHESFGNSKTKNFLPTE